MPPKLPNSKSSFHPRNKHQGSYDFEKLTTILPELSRFAFVNKHLTQTIDFSDAEAVKMLNKALLAEYYGVQNWDIPNGYLCPPIPGRADYVHYVADILAEANGGQVPEGKEFRCIDIGVGSNLIYPIIGHQEYGWSFVGTDIDPVSVKSAEAIVEHNSVLESNIELRLQPNRNHFFEGIIKKDEKFDVSFCNPPFYSSAEEARQTNFKKNQNLGKSDVPIGNRNFGGNSNELWCEGGELKFIISMIRESQKFAENCKWFTSLVSKKEHLYKINKELQKVKASQVKIIEMAQGQKISRLVAWSLFK